MTNPSIQGAAVVFPLLLSYLLNGQHFNLPHSSSVSAPVFFFLLPLNSLYSLCLSLSDSELNHREFQREVQILKSLRHRHLISLFAVCTASTPYWIITELMEKGSLLNFLRGKPQSVLGSWFFTFCSLWCDQKLSFSFEGSS